MNRKAFDDLVNWKNDKNRKPLILRGARQVGKTTLVNQFSSQFKQYIYLNLERPEDITIFAPVYGCLSTPLCSKTLCR